MSEPLWIDRVEALAIHDLVLAQHGGLAGLRDGGLLESALARPRNHHAYGEQSLPRLAAVYAAGIVCNHPFVDGNKRTGFLVAATFLELNGMDFFASEISVVERTLALAAATIDESAYAAWMEENCRLP